MNPTYAYRRVLKWQKACNSLRTCRAGGGLHFESDYDVINGPQLKSFPAGIRGEAASLEIAANNSIIVGDSFRFGNILEPEKMYR